MPPSCKIFGGWGGGGGGCLASGRGLAGNGVVEGMGANAIQMDYPISGHLKLTIPSFVQDLKTNKKPQNFMYCEH